MSKVSAEGAATTERLNDGKSGAADSAVWSLPSLLGVEREVGSLQEQLGRWLSECDDELLEMAKYQLEGRAKYFRPVTIFTCYRATQAGPVPERLILHAAAVELFHNYTLVVDDIIDRDRYRRGKLSLHCRFGLLPGLMGGAFFAWSAGKMVADDTFASRLFCELGERIAAVECRQWRLRRQPLGIEEWRKLAEEDTGAMFETCARLATRDGRLARFGLLLGTLYHACDDVADVRGTAALGGASERDITDRILTLPVALVGNDGETARLFESGGPEVNDELAHRLTESLPAAEAALDNLAEEAVAEAESSSESPAGLIELVRYTRALASA